MKVFIAALAFALSSVEAVKVSAKWVSFSQADEDQEMNEAVEDFKTAIYNQPDPEMRTMSEGETWVANMPDRIIGH